MQRTGILPALLIGSVAALIAVAGYPYLPGAQDPRNDVRRVAVQSVSPGPLVLPPMPLAAGQQPRGDLDRFEPQPVIPVPLAAPPIAPFAAIQEPGAIIPAQATAPVGTPPTVPQPPDIPRLDKPTVTSVKKSDAATALKQKSGAYFTNERTVKIALTPATLPNGQSLMVSLNGSALVAANVSGGVCTVADLRVQSNQILFFVKWNAVLSDPSDLVVVKVQQNGPTAVVDPQNFAFTPGGKSLRVHFSSHTPIDSATAVAGSIVFKNTTKGSPGADQAFTVNNFNADSNTLELGVDLDPGNYVLTVTTRVIDLYGNKLGKDETNVDGKEQSFDIVKPVGSDLPLVAPGISNRTGPYVPYQEYTEPRQKPQGFNPGDHVETRVARLYYFRDAHRVAQILNRDVKSYNRVAVDTRRRLAEQARNDAANQSLKRKVYERDAVQAAQDTRVKERDLKEAQDFLKNAAERRDKSTNDMAVADATANDPMSTQTQKDKATADSKKAKAALDTANDDTGKARARVLTAQDALQLAQGAELQKRETWQANLELEDKMRADQFRLEVAAMHEDPDTYGPGNPKSNDPVQQVSISVIGESEIHLRGPISGINVIREMVNQIDAPTGQVRIAVHTVQVNGERQEKMECVIGGIQDYIDHSRFLTQQSALMLRKAVLKVASRKAWIAQQRQPFDSQEARDQRYLHEFFGKDLIEELRVQKSEFLNTGNKLLSLNSMDTTSLASALFVIALAKNDTRQEILHEFRQMLAVDLPMAEQSFYEAGGVRGKQTHCNFGCFPRKQCFELMAQNARFQSFLGFFDAEVVGSDTLTPLQREFIKLAQIMKSRLITEMEFKQRVMERALVEDRAGGDYVADLIDARKKEDDAKKKLAESQQSMATQQTELLASANKVYAKFSEVYSQIKNQEELTERLKKYVHAWHPGDDADPEQVKTIRDKILKTQMQTGGGSHLLNTYFQTRLQADIKTMAAATTKVGFTYTQDKGSAKLKFDENGLPAVQRWAEEISGSLKAIQDFLDLFAYGPLEQITYDRSKAGIAQFELERANLKTGTLDIVNLGQIPQLQETLLWHIRDTSLQTREQFQIVTQRLSQANPDIKGAYETWARVKTVKKYFKIKKQADEIQEIIDLIDLGFVNLFKSEMARRMAADNLERSRRPLDHKKMLDMLIDEIHEKYVELLEGTRSYTANVDDYIKRLSTALDDDFNTQFYQPAFRQVRTIATSWDVTLGAIETTSILTNNRTYAKVDPQATMEFDLPRRSMFLTEAFASGKGLLDTYGALMQDPTFLNLARISAGMPTSTLALGQNVGVPAIRSVLPGMSRLSDEGVMAQSGSQAKSFGTPLDALVPDPAIYKFETGTAYEIRPVIQPDGQSVNFHFNYMYTTNIREPVRADEKHLGRVKRHFIDTNVQLGNYELREISKYQVTLKASRTAKGVPLLQDIPGLGILFRPLPSAESSLQQNIILGQSTIFPTLFDLMGLRWAPSIADLDPLALTNADFIVRQRKQFLNNRVFDYSSSKVDEALRIPEGERRGDLYRSQQSIPYTHPNGYRGPGMGLRDSNLKEGYDPKQVYPESGYVPGTSRDGHVNPNSDTERRIRDKMSQPPGMPEFDPMLLPYPRPAGPAGDPMLLPYPRPAGPVPPPPPMNRGPVLVPDKKQSSNAPNPASVFTTVRLSSADLNAVEPSLAPSRLAIYPVTPAPRRTLWNMMFGNR